MASPQLKAFLTKLDKELSSGANAWRKSTGDYRNHFFSFSKRRIIQALEVVLQNSANFKSNEELQEAMKVFQKEEFEPLLNKLETTLKTKFKQVISQAQAAEGVEKARFNANQYGFTAYITESVTGGKKYDYIARMYADELGDFYDEFLNLLGRKDLYRISESGAARQRREVQQGKRPEQDVYGMVDLTERRNAFNLEHVEGANVLHFINDSIVKALNGELKGELFVDEIKATKSIKQALTASEYEAFMTIFKDAKEGNIKVVIGSALLNVRAGGGSEKDLIKDLRNAIQKLSIVDVEGSDSLRQGARKKVVKATMEPVVKVAKKNKRVKATSEPYVIKNGVGKSERKKKSKITTAKNSGVIRKRKVAAKRGAGQAQPSLFSLIGIINEKLPQTVVGNMGSPRLNNRSGRFAQSVRVVDIARTSQGYPSIGYTYQTSPYQTFEPGRKQGSSDLDPRRLIDVSIRDIAQGMALGRFYTRRV